MVEVKQGPLSDAERIAKRLRPSNDHERADSRTTHGSGPTRTVTTIHHSGHQGRHGGDNEEHYQGGGGSTWDQKGDR